MGKKRFSLWEKNRELIWFVSMEIQRSDFQGSACGKPQARFFIFSDRSSTPGCKDEGSEESEVCNKACFVY